MINLNTLLLCQECVCVCIQYIIQIKIIYYSLSIKYLHIVIVYFTVSIHYNKDIELPTKNYFQIDSKYSFKKPLKVYCVKI